MIHLNTTFHTPSFNNLLLIAILHRQLPILYSCIWLHSHSMSSDCGRRTWPTVWWMGEGLTRSHKKFYMGQNVLSALDLDRPFGATHMCQDRNKWQAFVTMGISLWDPNLHRISKLLEELVVSQERLWSMKLISEIQY